MKLGFHEEILSYWDAIEFYHSIGKRWLRDYYKYLLKERLGVECNCYED